MENLDKTVAVLTRTPATLDALLRGLPESWVRSNEGKDTWSAFDIVGHLIVGERTVWMTRVRVILENGEARPFDPLDRLSQSRKRQHTALGRLLDHFAPSETKILPPVLARTSHPDTTNPAPTHPAP